MSNWNGNDIEPGYMDLVIIITDNKRGVKGIMRSQLFALKIKLARIEAGLTQSELATKMRKPKTWVVDIERGRTTPGAEECLRLAESLGLIFERVAELVIESKSYKLINAIRRSGYEIRIIVDMGHSRLTDDQGPTYSDLSTAHLMDSV